MVNNIKVFILNKNMVLSTILFTIMVGVFIAYVLYIMTKYGIQSSISESYYVLPKNRNWMFVLFTWLFAFPAMILGDSYLMFFAGGGIVFVGAAAAMHLQPTKTIHFIGALIGMVLGSIAIITQYHMWYLLPAVFVGIGLAAVFDKKHLLWWTEISVFSAISIAIGCSIF